MAPVSTPGPRGFSEIIQDIAIYVITGSSQKLNSENEQPDIEFLLDVLLSVADPLLCYTKNEIWSVCCHVC